MLDLIIGEHFDIGGRPLYEDRCAVRQLTTAGGLTLTLAVVADGVGGESKGERAAQLTLDTFLTQVQLSTEKSIPRLLTRAGQAANQMVFAEARSSGSKTMSSTLAVAAVDEKQALYVANVGDSRVYLCRKGKLTRLTVDHTFSTMMNFLGDLAPNFARPSQSEALVRAIGLRERVAVDIGFYVGVSDPEVATARGLKGIPLEAGDSVLVCTNGLVKSARATNTPYVSDEEIIRVLESKRGSKAAEQLVTYAVGRNPEDNISVGLIQVPDGSRLMRREMGRIWVFRALIALLVLLIAFSVLSFFAPAPRTDPAPATNVTAEKIGTLLQKAGAEQPLSTYQDIIAAESPLMAQVAAESRVYALSGVRLRFTGATVASLITVGSVLLRSDSPLVMLPGTPETTTLQFSVQTGCMGVQRLGETLATVSCFSGTCGYRLATGGIWSPIEAGNRLLIDLRTQVPIERISIPTSEKQQFRAALADLNMDRAKTDMVSCALNDSQ